MPRRSEEEVDAAIAAWKPVRHSFDLEMATRLAAATRAVVSDGAQGTPTAAKLDCGHVFRFLGWADQEQRRHDDPTAVAAYLEHLAAAGATSGTLNPTRAALRRYFVAPEPVVASDTSDTTVADAIADYSPDEERLDPGLWAVVAEDTRIAVAATNPTNARQARSRMSPTSLYLAWAYATDRTNEPFTPDSVERFLASGRSAWTQPTHRSYSSVLRRIASIAKPELWPTSDSRAGSVAEVCTIDEFEAMCRSIRGRHHTVRRQLSALVLLARGCGIVGASAALVRPEHIRAERGHFTAEVTGGAAPRTVKVLAPLGEPLTELAERAADAGDTFMLGGRGLASAVSNRSADLVGIHTELTGLTIEPRRMRNAYLSHLVAQPLGLGAILDQAGLRTAASLDAILRAGTPDPDYARLAAIAALL